jgi:hypothetical protein
MSETDQKSREVGVDLQLTVEKELDGFFDVFCLLAAPHKHEIR